MRWTIHLSICCAQPSAAEFQPPFDSIAVFLWVTPTGSLEPRTIVTRRWTARVGPVETGPAPPGAIAVNKTLGTLVVRSRTSTTKSARSFSSTTTRSFFLLARSARRSLTDSCLPFTSLASPSSLVVIHTRGSAGFVDWPARRRADTTRSVNMRIIYSDSCRTAADELMGLGTSADGLDRRVRRTRRRHVHRAVVVGDDDARRRRRAIDRGGAVRGGRGPGVLTRECQRRPCRPGEFVVLVLVLIRSDGAPCLWVWGDDGSGHARHRSPPPRLVR